MLNYFVLGRIGVTVNGSNEQLTLACFFGQIKWQP
jgi:hypothetical protein